MELKFLRGSSASFQTIDPKVSNYFYLVSNTDNTIDFYLGDVLIAKGSTVSELAAEIDRAKAAEKDLADLIADLTSGSTSLEEALNAEITRAKAAEEANAAAIAAEITRATAAEQANATAIAAEEQRATAAEEANADAIAAEKTRAEGEESAIRSEFAAADTALKTELLGEVSDEDAKTLAALNDRIDSSVAEAKSYSILKVTEGLEANVKEAYKLVDEENVQVGALIPIYKDSALKEVSLVDEALQFTYILADGTESTVSVDVSKFLSESEFSNGLQVIGGIVSVKVDTTSEAFLTVGADGVKLSGIADAIAAEEQRATAAEEANAAAIAAEITRATAAEEANAAAIAAEITRATAAEEDNADAIAAEEQRATAAEESNAAAIAAESEQRKALKGDSNIEVAIDTEGKQTISLVWDNF